MSDTPPAAADPTATASDAVDAAEAARLKREARKARILSKGSDRLARITNTGRGEGASAYLNDTTPSLPSTPKPNDATAAAAAAAASVARADDDDPLEVDISTLPRRGGPFGAPFGEDATNPFLMGGSGAGAGEAQNPMEALMAMMQGGPPGAGGPGGAPGQQPDMSGLPPQLAAMMQQLGAAGGGGGPFGGAPGAAMPTAVKTKSLTERLFGVVQATLIVALAILAAKTSLFDTDHSSVVPDSVTDTFTRDAPAVGVLQRWARLGYQRPSVDEWGLNPASTLSSLSMGPLSSLPLFWIFLGLEIVLQAVRIAVVAKKTPAPPSMLASLTAMLPIPNLHLAISLVGKYLALINAFVNDIAILVFVFGATVLWSAHQLGGAGMLESPYVHDEL
ncbi:hypothetical protein PANT_16d00020 [Moesziomyces antarcticus T-34]|uniref:Golgi to ER traffic protein 2 n=1 Tax=Pseudozyma antarctica (strain T-34) TaxID=1151754 RepID=M9LRB8_PSEA3|nr:hypothetical protein PANT_16d00020 [Moesziomyces antarcticus T-34]